MMSRRHKVHQAKATSEAAVWIDHDEAVIVDQGSDGRRSEEHLDRAPAESEATFDVRAIDEVIDREHVLVSGPSAARLEFERAYVAVTHRPDRLTDIEPEAGAAGTRRPA